MTLSKHLLITATALSTLIFTGCQAQNSETVNKVETSLNEAALNEDISKEDLTAIIKDSLVKAGSTQGAGTPKMWSYADEDTTVYLFGTVHILKPELKWQSNQMREAFEGADTLVIEADATSPESVKRLQGLTLQHGVFTDGSTLSGILSAEDKTVIEEALSAQGIPLSAVEHLKPWMVSIQLTLLQMLKSGYDAQSGVEHYFLGHPKIKDKKVDYLETVETQINALSGASIDEQVKGLMATIGTLELGPDYLDTLVAEWADGDVAGIGAMISHPALYGSKSAYDSLLTDRNRNWIAPLRALLDEPGSKFVAVGTGHLAGPDSVIKMLKAEGIKVTPVN